MIELRHLRYFATLARELHFGRASKALHIEQPALTHNIQQLESELGVRLLLRTTRHVELSEAGRAYLYEAIRALKQVEDATHAAQKATKGETGQLNFGYDNSLVLSRMPQAIKQFQARFPDVRLVPHEHFPDQLLEGLLSGELDVIYTCAMRRHPQLDSVTLERPPWLCAMNKDHPLAKKKAIQWGELKDEKVALPPYSNLWDLHQSLLDSCREAGFIPRAPFSAFGVLAIFALVSANLCVSFIFDTGGAMTIPEIAFRPLLPMRRLELQLCWRKGSLSQAATSFVEHCIQSTH